MPADRPDMVVFSTADWFTRYWTNKQHTAAALNGRGHRVLYVETPGIRAPRLGDRRDLRRLFGRLWSGLAGLSIGPREVRPGLWVLSPLVLPWGRSTAIVRAFNRGVFRYALKRFFSRHGFDRPEVWTYHPFMLELLDHEERGPLAYHAVDDIAAVPGVDGPAFERAELELLAAADVVCVTSRPLEARARRHNANVHFMPNVVDETHFGRAFDGLPEPEELAAIPHPRLVYHGVLSDYKVDVNLLAAVAKAHPGWQVVLIGEAREGQPESVLAELGALGNVHLIGGRDYARLPAYLAQMDVGLLPTLRNAYTASMYPMKYYEYLAAGLPVASTDLPFAQDAGGFLELGNDAEAFAAAVVRQLDRGRLTRGEARQAVGDNTWEQRLDKMLALTAARRG